MPYTRQVRGQRAAATVCHWLLLFASRRRAGLRGEGKLAFTTRAAHIHTQLTTPGCQGVECQLAFSPSFTACSHDCKPTHTYTHMQHTTPGCQGGAALPAACAHGAAGRDAPLQADRQLHRAQGKGMGMALYLCFRFTVTGLSIKLVRAPFPCALTPRTFVLQGAFIIPDIVSACHQGFTKAKEFDPERFRCAIVCIWCTTIC